MGNNETEINVIEGIEKGIKYKVKYLAPSKNIDNGFNLSYLNNNVIKFTNPYSDDTQIPRDFGSLLMSLLESDYEDKIIKSNLKIPIKAMNGLVNIALDASCSYKKEGIEQAVFTAVAGHLISLGIMEIVLIFNPVGAIAVAAGILANIIGNFVNAGIDDYMFDGHSENKRSDYFVESEKIYKKIKEIEEKGDLTDNEELFNLNKRLIELAYLNNKNQILIYGDDEIEYKIEDELTTIRKRINSKNGEIENFSFDIKESYELSLLSIELFYLESFEDFLISLKTSNLVKYRNQFYEEINESETEIERKSTNLFTEIERVNNHLKFLDHYLINISSNWPSSNDVKIISNFINYTKKNLKLYYIEPIQYPPTKLIQHQPSINRIEKAYECFKHIEMIKKRIDISSVVEKKIKVNIINEILFNRIEYNPTMFRYSGIEEFLLIEIEKIDISKYIEEYYSTILNRELKDNKQKINKKNNVILEYRENLLKDLEKVEETIEYQDHRIQSGSLSKDEIYKEKRKLWDIISKLIVIDKIINGEIRWEENILFNKFMIEEAYKIKSIDKLNNYYNIRIEKKREAKENESEVRKKIKKIESYRTKLEIPGSEELEVNTGLVHRLHNRILQLERNDLFVHNKIEKHKLDMVLNSNHNKVIKKDNVSKLKSNSINKDNKKLTNDNKKTSENLNLKYRDVSQDRSYLKKSHKIKSGKKERKAESNYRLESSNTRTYNIQNSKPYLDSGNKDNSVIDNIFLSILLGKLKFEIENLEPELSQVKIDLESHISNKVIHIKDKTSKDSENRNLNIV